MFPRRPKKTEVELLQEKVDDLTDRLSVVEKFLFDTTLDNMPSFARSTITNMHKKTSRLNEEFMALCNHLQLNIGMEPPKMVVKNAEKANKNEVQNK